MTKKANQFSPTTTLASSFNINDNDFLHHPLIDVTNAKTVTLFRPLQEGEIFYEPRQKQLDQTAEYIYTADINVPEKLKYGTVSLASRQLELNYYYTTATQEMNKYTTYPQGVVDTEGRVIKEGYTSPVIAKKIEPPKGYTSVAMPITSATIISNAIVCHHGKETEGVARVKYAVPFLRRPIEPPERGDYKQELVDTIMQTTNQVGKMVYDDTSSPARRAPFTPKKKCVAGASSRVLVSEAPGWYLITSVEERGDQSCLTPSRLFVSLQCNYF